MKKISVDIKLFQLGAGTMFWCFYDKRKDRRIWDILYNPRQCRMHELAREFWRETYL